MPRYNFILFVLCSVASAPGELLAFSPIKVGPPVAPGRGRGRGRGVPSTYTSYNVPTTLRSSTKVDNNDTKTIPNDDDDIDTNTNANPISKRSQSVESFKVMDVLQRANELENQGHEVIHCEVGQPESGAPVLVADAAVRALTGPPREVMGYTGKNTLLLLTFILFFNIYPSTPTNY